MTTIEFLEKCIRCPNLRYIIDKSAEYSEVWHLFSICIDDIESGFSTLQEAKTDIDDNISEVTLGKRTLSQVLCDKCAVDEKFKHYLEVA